MALTRGALSLLVGLLPLGCNGTERLEVVLDDCLDDEQKVYPGVCGCGIPEERCVPLKSALVHRYAFDGTGTRAIDGVGGADGKLMNTELMDVGELYLDRGGELEQYVELPNGIISVLSSATFEAWVIWEPPPVAPMPFWERIFDFGVSTKGEDQREFGRSYLFLAPGQPGTTPPTPRTAFRDDNLPGEVIVNGRDAMPSNTAFEVAVVVDDAAHELRLYLNGVEQPNKVPLSEPLGAIQDVNNWLGRSQFIADSRFGGSLLEFRIYDRALTAAELADSASLGDSPAFLQQPKPAAQDGSGAP